MQGHYKLNRSHIVNSNRGARTFHTQADKVYYQTYLLTSRFLWNEH